MSLKSILAQRLAALACLIAVLAAGTYGLAAAITVEGVRHLGAGVADVVAPPDVTAVRWALLAGDPSRVDGVTIYFAADVAYNGTIHVMVDETGTPAYPYLDVGSATFDAENDLRKGIYVDLPGNPNATAIGGIAITVVEE